MALAAAAEDYFRSMNPLASKIYEDIVEAKNSYENIWETLTEKEKDEIINESIIKPEIGLKYALLDNLDFDINDPPVRKDDLMSFFGRDHGQKMIHDENGSYRDEHSAPFLYQTKSQLNLCILSEHRHKDVKPTSPPPVMSKLALSHSKVVSELKNALKSHELRNMYKDEREVTSPNFISKFIGNFKNKDEERECLVSGSQMKIVAPSDNFFKTPQNENKFEKEYRSSVVKSNSENKDDDRVCLVSGPPMQTVASSDNFFNFKSPRNENKFEKEYRSSVVKSNSDLSEENRGLLSSSQASSGTDFQSTETLTDSGVPKTGYDFLDNW